MVKLTKAFIKLIQCNFSGPAFVFQEQKQPPEDATLLKRRLWHRCFPVNFMKFLRTPFLQNTTGRLLSLAKWLRVRLRTK